MKKSKTSILKMSRSGASFYRALALGLVFMAGSIGYSANTMAQTYLNTPNYLGGSFTMRTKPDYMGGWTTETYNHGPSIADLVNRQFTGRRLRSGSYGHTFSSRTRPNFMGGWITESSRHSPSIAEMVHRALDR